MIKAKFNVLSRQYLAALREYLEPGPKRRPAAAQALGRRALTLGLDTLDLARMHEGALPLLNLPGHSPAARKVMSGKVKKFFGEVLTPIEATHLLALNAKARLRELNHELLRYNLDLDVAAQSLKKEVRLRKAAEQALTQSQHHYSQSLDQSRRMHNQLQSLSRQLLSAQEEERKRISRELHDVIAQTLAGINVRLAALRHETTVNIGNLERNIAQTQKLVQQSVEIVHRFARELRPRVLDDLGLIPALHTFMKAFRERTGIQVSLSAFAAIEAVQGDKRTVLYRVTQEALNNVASHAKASEADVTIQQHENIICLKISDNGKGFRPQLLPRGQENQRLGLLGMKERVEMVHGNFSVESSPGQGTTVNARIPLLDRQHKAEAAA